MHSIDTIAFTGTPIRSFRPLWGNILSRIGLGVVLMLVAAASPFVAFWAWWTSAMPWWVGLLAPIWSLVVGLFGYALVSEWTQRIGRRVVVYAEGFRLIGFADGGAAPWQEVRKVTVSTIYEDLPLKDRARALAPKQNHVEFTFDLTQVDGVERKFEIVENDLDSPRKFQELVEAGCAAHSIDLEKLEKYAS